MKAIKVIVKNWNRKLAFTFYSYEDMLGETDDVKLANARELGLKQYNQEALPPEIFADNAESSIMEFSEPELLIDSHNGVYIPQIFAERYEQDIRDFYKASGSTDEAVEEDLALLKSPSNDLYWEAWDNLISTFEKKVGGKTFILYQEQDLFLIQQDSPVVEEFGDWTEFPEPTNKTTIVHKKTKWYLEKIDSTHAYMSNQPDTRGFVFHIGEMKNEPYYDDVYQWLKDGLDLNGKVYDSDTVAPEEAIIEHSGEELGDFDYDTRDKEVPPEDSTEH